MIRSHKCCICVTLTGMIWPSTALWLVRRLNCWRHTESVWHGMKLAASWWTETNFLWEHFSIDWALHSGRNPGTTCSTHSLCGWHHSFGCLRDVLPERRPVPVWSTAELGHSDGQLSDGHGGQGLWSRFQSLEDHAPHHFAELASDHASARCGPTGTSHGPFKPCCNFMQDIKSRFCFCPRMQWIPFCPFSTDVWLCSFWRQDHLHLSSPSSLGTVVGPIECECPSMALLWWTPRPCRYGSHWTCGLDLWWAFSWLGFGSRTSFPAVRWPHVWYCGPVARRPVINWIFWTSIQIRRCGFSFMALAPACTWTSPSWPLDLWVWANYHWLTSPTGSSSCHERCPYCLLRMQQKVSGSHQEAGSTINCQPLARP